MSLADVEIRYKYKSPHINVIEEFLIPCFKQSNRYDRATGYFSSEPLKHALAGVIEFIKKESCKMRIITSPHLSAKDIEDIKSGLRKEYTVITENIIDEIERIAKSEDRTLLATLGWLISNNILEMKIGDMNTGRYSIFHEKLGIFKDKYDNVIVFYGSLNETYQGYFENYDSIRILKSGIDPPDKIAEEIRDFELVWNNLDRFVKTYEISDAIKNAIIKYKPESKEELLKQMEDYFDKPKKTKQDKFKDFNPNDLIPWNHQQRTLLKIKENNYNGILKMATGTGKTAIALFTFEQFFREKKRFGNRIIILVPSTIIGKQWEIFLEENSSIYEYTFRYDSKISLADKRELIRVWNNDNLLKKGNIFLIITIQSLHNFDFNDKKVNFLVADEVHSYGTINYMNKIETKLSDVPYIMGLSATPERYYDVLGTERIKHFFGQNIFKFNIKEAQKERKFFGSETVLSEYNYYPFITNPTITEEEEIRDLSIRINRLMGISETYNESSEAKSTLTKKVKDLLIERARKLKLSRNKLVVLRNILEANYHNLLQCIIYCETLVQVNDVIDLFKELGFSSYITYHSKLKKRNEALKLFKQKSFKFVISMHCLDQGVDIPQCQSLIFMSSSGNPREYIQRRGRVLRNQKNKPRVKIFDIFVFPNETNKMYYGLVKNQLIRAWEFIDCSLTPEEKMKFNNIKKIYDIWDDDLEKIINELRGE